MARRLLLIGLVACGGDDAPIEDTAACPDPTLTWENAGQPFVTAWCTTCHAAGLEGAARFGAPPSLNLDTVVSVRVYADRVRARSVPDDATMPPAGPAPSDDRQRFAAWLDCGAPGTTTPAAPACSAGASAGDWTASVDGPPCPAVDTIAGDLVVDTEVTDGWECLCTVEGDVRITGGARVSLPSLSTASALAVEGARDLVTLSLPSLEQAGDVSLQGLPLLASVDLALLRTATSLEVLDVPALTDLGLHRLDRVEGSLTLVAAPSLSFLQPLDSLTDVGGSLVLDDLGITDPLMMRRLEHIGGNLELLRHGGWTSLGGLDVLTAIDGDLVIQDNPVLAVVPGIQGPTVVGGDLVLLGNPQLSTDEGLALLARLDVQGEVVTP